MKIEGLVFSLEDSPCISVTLSQEEAMVFAPDLHLRILSPDRNRLIYSADLSASFSIGWLPRGRYQLRCHPHDLDAPQGDFVLLVEAFCEQARQRVRTAVSEAVCKLPGSVANDGVSKPAWSIISAQGTAPVQELAWNRGHEDWFYRHFDHAALVVTDYLLKQHPLLGGRILDVGCGDGIIDLGIFLRTQPEEFVGIDPFRGFERLPGIVEENHLPADVLDDPRLKFRPDDGNDIPYPDDYFDVVVSWGSLEHIAGGYEQTLVEIRRVLKDGGLLFVHPGLYFGALGNHLGEFFEDPFVHLKLDEKALRSEVLGTEPSRMDRAGHVATPAEYWQWYTELNPIEVSAFERQLRQLGFEPWRAAVRTSDVIEYTPELQRYPIQDLATSELYLSAWNRKQTD